MLVLAAGTISFMMVVVVIIVVFVIMSRMSIPFVVFPVTRILKNREEIIGHRGAPL